ncbi:hypothetical protein [Hymenobacter latericus]|uniref:hypothetical protein n=1 Tax=Hymenobacter sp. YIM 151858-1 TaxID=2987688 RepID=UPI00222726E5|nr:hypothetical protein [Hymenobacter sp. YIM 151858-1]UYZ58537.1 hypothetical protein OIS50_15935 [Hymenobacter sp. YIM 151858-1]
MKHLLFPLLLAIAILNAPAKEAPPKGTKWEGTISNGMKGDKISFVVSPDGKKLSELTFSGYWRCSGKLEQTTVGPDSAFNIVGGKVAGVAVDPPSGGSTAWRFEVQGEFSGKAAAKGTFRMNINNLGCDTYKLQWAAAPVGVAK